MIYEELEANVSDVRSIPWQRRLCFDKVDILGNISDVKAMLIDREPAFMVKLTCSHCFRGQR